MKLFLFLICLFTSTFLFSQDPFSKADARQVIDTFFEGFHKGDTLLMKSVMAEDLVMQTVFTTKEGENKINTEFAEGLITAITNRP
ncbi:MAG: nuclear transport factor 2 family protein, partial [Flavobacteriaceae bacterium]